MAKEVILYIMNEPDYSEILVDGVPITDISPEHLYRGKTCLDQPKGRWKVRPKCGFYIDTIAKDIKPKRSILTRFINSLYIQRTPTEP
jgi:hypothetical protein